MKKLQVFGEIYEADFIYATEDRITGENANGFKLFEFVGIKNPDRFVLMDGATYDVRPVADGNTLAAAMMGGAEMANENVAGQVHRALQLFAQTLDETTAMEIADLYPEWAPGQAYKPGTILKYGKNAAGKGQLYSVMQAHNSQADWQPGPAMAALYKAIGFTDSGLAIWVQPQGGHDAYKVGDIVMHNSKKWRSTVNGNVWAPGVYGWVEQP